MIKSKKISAEDQKQYQLGVGMLLYLVKHLIPNISNMTRKLLKANDGENPVALKIATFN